MGGSTASITAGTRIPRLQPLSASACTQSESTECSDHSTTTQSDSARAAAMARA